MRIGARLVVEILGLAATAPATDVVRLVPQRSRHGLALLFDKLQQAQHDADPLADSCSGQLIPLCAEMPVALPVSTADWGAIVLLDQLFDRCAMEWETDAEARHWFARLRIPVIRYALMDYSFFFARQNLLRRFLNQSYQLLLSSTDTARGNERRQRLQQFADRLLTQFSGRIGQVNSICIEAQSWFAGETEKVQRIQGRLRELEIRRQREQVAEPRVIRELNRIAAGRMLPLAVNQFLHGEWRRSLRLVSQREGEQGATWKRQLRTSESLVALCEDCLQGQQMEQHRTFFPVLMRNLRDLLLSVADDSAGRDTALEPLELALTALVNGAVPETGVLAAIPQPDPAVLEAQLIRVSAKSMEAIDALEEGAWLRLRTAGGGYELCRIVLKGAAEEPWVLISQTGSSVARKTAVQLALGLEGGVVQLVAEQWFWDRELDAALQRLYRQWQDQQQAQKRRRAQSPEPVVAQAQVTQTADPVSPAPAPGEGTVEETPQTPATGVTAVDPATPLTSAEPEDYPDYLPAREVTEEEMNSALAAIDALQVGGWLSQETTQGEQRCKLAVRIKASDKLVFVNRLGIKVMEIQRRELARLLVLGVVSIVDTGRGFDSSLERIVRSIQQEKQG